LERFVSNDLGNEALDDITVLLFDLAHVVENQVCAFVVALATFAFDGSLEG
jgi:hypothetical protein